MDKSACWRGCLLLGLCLGLPGLALAGTRFDFAQVRKLARQAALQPWQAPAAIPEFMQQLDYDRYRQLRFDPARSLWRPSHTRFQVMLIAPGENYRHPVRIDVVDAAGVHAVPFRKDWFSWPAGLAAKVPDDLGYAGFKLTFPLDGPDVPNQFLVFAGASYFRGVARGQGFGISARGLAIDTGLPQGEKFPSFTRFWLVRPSPGARSMEFYALLEGPGLTGAYRFVVHPGAPLRMDVSARLYARQNVDLLGLAPLTSMFQYGSNTPRPPGAWRPAVHDSDGLLIHAASGEWLWRPLRNPRALHTDYFEAGSVRGFGLLQRATGFHAYEDAEARYDRRPSTWVQPRGDWGSGHVVLVQIPTDSEINDNIVAFWSPRHKLRKGDVRDLAYRLYFGRPDMMDEPQARVVATHVGHHPGQAKSDPDLRMVVDFAGGPLADLPVDAKVKAVVTGLDGTRIRQQSLHALRAPDQWRLSLRVQPPSGKPMRLRAYLKLDGKTLSETWSYALPAHNRFHAND